MTKKAIGNMAASVRDQLKAMSRTKGRPFADLLLYFAIERLLYRLSKSKHADEFVLKGALMLQYWGLELSRATRDIDLLGRATVSVERMLIVFREIVRVRVEDDGLRFESESVAAGEIRTVQKYQGVRVSMTVFLGNARIPLQVDVGFGDVVTPKARRVVVRSLLGFDGAKLFGTTPETAIAEKVQSMIALDMANSRMKDFYDVWMLSKTRQFSGRTLSRAIRATFKRRDTPLPDENPRVFMEAFYANDTKQVQYRAFLKKSAASDTTVNLEAVVKDISAFLMPVFQSLIDKEQFEGDWPPGGPWR
ncbi:MAG TPA: nucleotidyl transferase AbiEii/AbiGii toxin family protein [Myxococcota bacterium]|nr:nucleotidyl transferase AbiEii/AbiGii toxin family protein [Myxococcota bacterium]